MKISLLDAAHTVTFMGCSTVPAALPGWDFRDNSILTAPLGIALVRAFCCSSAFAEVFFLGPLALQGILLNLGEDSHAPTALALCALAENADAPPEGQPP